MPDDAARPPLPQGGKFTTGSIWRHVVVMSGATSVGLIAIFAVDLLNFFYISLLQDRSMSAAVGFAGVISFFLISVSIGLTIGLSVLVGRQLGAGLREQARQTASSGLIGAFLILLACAVLLCLCLPWVLDALGAAGPTRHFTALFIYITAPSVPVLSLGMAGGALLRATGDAKRSMYVTLAGAAVAAVLDPALILFLHQGILGAAISTWFARLALGSSALLSLIRVHNLLGPVTSARIASDTRQIMRIAGPAVLTNLATPVGNAFIARTMAQFGPAAIAGQAAIDRLTPVAFALVFALTGAIGPILAQNLGAQNHARVQQTVRNSLIFTLLVVCAAWALLALGQNLIVQVFSIKDSGIPLVLAFCQWGAGAFIFLGALFVANATFNNLKRPLLATGFNWGRATLGTIPLVMWGAHYGPVGILAGQALGCAIFGIASVLTANYLTGKPATTPAASITVR